MLERGLPILATVAMIAPLLGFLGTVTGMINSFEALAVVGLNNPRLSRKASRRRSSPRPPGLIIAIPVQMAYNYFVTQREHGRADHGVGRPRRPRGALRRARPGGTHPRDLTPTAPELRTAPAGAR